MIEGSLISIQVFWTTKEKKANPIEAIAHLIFAFIWSIMRLIAVIILGKYIMFVALVNWDLPLSFNLSKSFFHHTVCLPAFSLCVEFWKKMKWVSFVLQQAQNSFWQTIWKWEKILIKNRTKNKLSFCYRSNKKSNSEKLLWLNKNLQNFKNSMFSSVMPPKCFLMGCLCYVSPSSILYEQST